MVSKAEMHKSNVYPSERCGQTTVLKDSTSEVEVKQGVDQCKVFEVNDLDSVDYGNNSDELGWESDIKFWEVEKDSPFSQITDVQGRLRKNLKFWQEVLKAPDTVLEYIQNGYRLPFRFLPPSHNQCNSKSTETHQKFVDEAVLSLLTNRCIRRVEAEPWVCSPLLVVSNSTGKLRLVLNLRYVNQFLHVTKFKYEDLRVAALMFERDEYMFKFDLKSGYHHVDIHCEHQKYLGFRWDTRGCPKFYVFTVLPFGLSTACYVFTKLLRPMIRHWRGRGLKAIIYLDDGIVAVKGKDMALEESRHVKQDLESAGFVINMEKSVWDACNHLEWLGFQIDLSKGEFKVPQYKLDRLKLQLCEIEKGQSVPARFLASLIGKILSMSLALGLVTRLMTRSLYGVLNSKATWCQKLVLTPEALSEVKFWVGEITKFNGQHIWPRPSAVRLVYSDASSTGYGGYLVEHGNKIANGYWSESESMQSSTWRELKAVRLVLESFQSELQNERVRWFTDNQNVVRIVQHGSRNSDLQAEALAIFSLCVKNYIRIEPEWIPREQNELADYCSRLVDYDDWRLNPVVFQWLDELWGPHTVDRFADHVNAQTPRFNSRFWVPGSEAVDTFTCNWGTENNWWCPPIYLVSRVLRHAKNTKAKGTLIIPEWPSAPYWPLLFPNGWDPANCVLELLELPSSEELFLPGRLGSNLFGGLPNTPVLALRLGF